MRHPGGRLVDVDHPARTVGKAHREARPGHEPRPILYPGTRPVVVVRVQPDAMGQLRGRLRRPVAPDQAVEPARPQRWHIGVRGLEVTDLGCVDSFEVGWRAVVTAPVLLMQRYLEALRDIAVRGR